MKILLLGDKKLKQWLTKRGEDVIWLGLDRIDVKYIQEHKIEFIISHNYRHIISKEIIDLLPNRIINLHISLLPYNRGADPNLWSWVDGTPKGVTIHYIDEGIDTGDIIVQREVEFSNPEKETLRSTYIRLQYEMEFLFYENWYKIRDGKCRRIKQFHRSQDKQKLQMFLEYGWDTPVKWLKGQK